MGSVTLCHGVVGWVTLSHAMVGWVTLHQVGSGLVTLGTIRRPTVAERPTGVLLVINRAGHKSNHDFDLRPNFTGLDLIRSKNFEDLI